MLNATVNVSYGVGQVARFENQIVTTAMSQGGDSGSLLVAGDALHAVGLLFAGSEQATIHNPIQVRGDPVRRTEEKWTRWNWREHSEKERIEKLKGMTLPIDEGVGQLRKTLVELGIEKNTIILFFIL